MRCDPWTPTIHQRRNPCALTPGLSLPAAVQSVLNQSYGSFELLIIDDASSDVTPRIAQAFAASGQPGCTTTATPPTWEWPAPETGALPWPNTAGSPFGQRRPVAAGQAGAAGRMLADPPRGPGLYRLRLHGHRRAQNSLLLSCPGIHCLPAATPSKPHLLLRNPG
ncbi:MAG: glycosyltransferase [Oscillospiraceae bacterium]